MRKLEALKRLSRVLATPESVEAYNRYYAWASQQERLVSILGPSGGRNIAISLENEAAGLEDRKDTRDAADRFLKAAEQWTKLAKPENPYYEEALFSVGFDHYRRAESLSQLLKSGLVEREEEEIREKARSSYETALEWFRRHIEHVDGLPSGDRSNESILHNLAGSVLFSVKTHSGEVMGSPEKVIAIADGIEQRYPGANLRQLMSIMGYRLEARLKLGQLREAEGDLLAPQLLKDLAGVLGPKAGEERRMVP